VREAGYNRFCDLDHQTVATSPSGRRCGTASLRGWSPPGITKTSRAQRHARADGDGAIGVISTRRTNNTTVIFLLRRVNFAPQKLSIEIDRPRDNLIGVTFAIVATKFAEASQAVKIISGDIEPP
jgi:hypothetical protein